MQNKRSRVGIVAASVAGLMISLGNIARATQGEEREAAQKLQRDAMLAGQFGRAMIAGDGNIVPRRKVKRDGAAFYEEIADKRRGRK